MSNRRIIILLLVSIGSLHTKAQEHPVSGAAAYEIANDYDHRTLEFWFTAQDYIYKYKQLADIRETPAFKNKKYNSPQDSLEDIKNIQALNDRIKMTPLQYWYGKLGSDEVIFSSFDNTLKTYCVRDTVTFVKWQLLPDTMTIHDMPCQKASGAYGDVTYTAWYAPSIPVSVAPLQFRGLPGLLVKVTNNTTRITISLTDLEWPAK